MKASTLRKLGWIAVVVGAIVAVFSLLEPIIAKSQCEAGKWWACAKSKEGASVPIVLVGLFLAAFGVGFVRVGTKVCPSCAKRVKGEAKLCRFCRHEFAA